MAEARIEPATLFINYAPVPLAIGTSGLRGLIKYRTDPEAFINVKARYLLISILCTRTFIVVRKYAPGDRSISSAGAPLTIARPANSR